MKQLYTLLLFTLITSLLSAQSVNIEGDPYGGNPYPTIDSALTVSNDGDVILIEGMHTERLTINKAIILRGSDPTTDIIQAHADTAAATGRVITVNELGNGNITIENLTIRHGNAGGGNGAGLLIDKVAGLATLNNLIIEDNTTTRNGGGVSLLGSNVNMNGCIIRRNSATVSSGNTGDAGGMHIVSANATGIDAVVNISNCLIADNSAIRNGGGFIINGNHGSGDQYIITVNFENTTIAFNHGENRGGSGQVWGVDIVDGGGGHPIGETNVYCTMKHVTIARNTSTATDNFGLYFTVGNANTGPVFDLYNSIVVSAGLLGNRAINFTNPVTTDVINCIIGGQLNITNVVNNLNTSVGNTAGQAGIPDEFGFDGDDTPLLLLDAGSPAINYCTEETGVPQPSTDARGFDRDGTPDAGAYEFGVVNTKEIVYQPLQIFPNPSSDLVQIQNVENIESIKVYALTGILVKNVQDSNQLDVSELSKGMYLVIVESEDGLFGAKLMVE